MRRSSAPICFGLVLLSACGANGGPDAAAGAYDNCEIAQSVQQQILDELAASAPRCSSDADCVMVNTRIDAAGAFLDLCTTSMHREAAAKWDPTSAAVLVEMQLRPSDVTCSVEASCVRSRAVCTAGICASAPAP